jgi:hypothetical protein
MYATSWSTVSEQRPKKMKIRIAKRNRVKVSVTAEAAPWKGQVMVIRMVSLQIAAKVDLLL